MNINLLAIVSILVLTVGSAAVPAVASESPLSGGGLQSAVATRYTSGSGFMPVAWNSSVRNVSLFNREGRLIPITFNPVNYNINLGYVAVIVGSGAVAGVVADMVFDSGAFTVLGALAGAALGGEWYQRGNAAAVVNILNSREDRLAKEIFYPEGGLPLNQAIAGN